MFYTMNVAVNKNPAEIILLLGVPSFVGLFASKGKNQGLIFSLLLQ